jgi:hypothetical protein
VETRKSTDSALRKNGQVKKETMDKLSGFMPVATSSLVNPGRYQATCTEVHLPKVFRAYKRWYMRVDFAIHDDGSIVSLYLNLGDGTHPNTQLGSRSGYWRVWTVCVGRNPIKGEPMDPAKMLGAEVTVTVVTKERHGGGEYSVVSEVKAPELER